MKVMIAPVLIANTAYDMPQDMQNCKSSKHCFHSSLHCNM